MSNEITALEMDFTHSLDRFRKAVNHLLAPWEITTMQGYEVVMPPLVDHIAEGPSSRSTFPMGGDFGSRPPIWMGGIDWQAGIVATVARTFPAALSLPMIKPSAPRVALEWASAASWSMSAGPTLDHVAGALETARWDALRLLWPESFTLDAACPECGAETHRGPRSDGDMVNTHALSVTEMFAECRACAHVWWGAEIATQLAPALATQDVVDNFRFPDDF